MPPETNELKQYLAWLIAAGIAILGVRHFKEFIVFVLVKLYQIFIQNNPNAA